jgi:hypothetical protein
MLAGLFLFVGAVNAACLFTSTGWTQAAHGLAAALCGMQVQTRQNKMHVTTK